VIRYTAESLPRFWWLSPWSACREMHKALAAMQMMSEVDDRAIAVLKAELKASEQAVSRLGEDRHRLLNRVAELERGLDRLHDAIISGGAIVPDAEPEKEDAR